MPDRRTTQFLGVGCFRTECSESGNLELITPDDARYPCEDGIITVTGDDGFEVMCADEQVLITPTRTHPCPQRPLVRSQSTPYNMHTRRRRCADPNSADSSCNATSPMTRQPSVPSCQLRCQRAVAPPSACVSSRLQSLAHPCARSHHTNRCLSLADKCWF